MTLVAIIAGLCLAFTQGDSHRFPSKGFAFETSTEGWTVDAGVQTPGGFKVTLESESGDGKVGASVLCAQVPRGTSARQAQTGTLTFVEGREEYGGHELLEAILIAGLEAPGMLVEWNTQDLGAVRIVMRHVVVGQRAYLIQGHAPAEQWETQMPIIDRLFASFEVLEANAQEQLALDAERLAERCGSELNWAQDWQEASSTARETNRQVLVLVNSYPGFDLPDSSRFTTFMDEDVLALVQTEFVPLRLTAGMPAPMRDHSAYGLSASTFGRALLLCEPDGTVRASTPHLQPEVALPWLWEQLGKPRVAPRGEALSRIRVSLDRGDFARAEEALVSALPAAEGSSRVLLLLQLARLHRLRGEGPLALQALDRAHPVDAEMKARVDCARAELLVREMRFGEGHEALRPHVDGTLSVWPKAMYLMSMLEQVRSGTPTARPWRERLVTEFPESRWAWLAGALIQYEALLPVTKPGELLGWPRPEVLRLMITPASAAMDSSRTARAAREARDWLLREQREDGSWPCPTDLRRASGVPPDQLAMAINALGARALLAQGNKDHAQVEQALRFLLQADLKRRTQLEPMIYMDYTAWAAWSQLELLADAVEAQLGDRETLVAFASRLVGDMQLRVRANGGWSYLLALDVEGKTATEQSISFTTAAVVIGLLRARDMGATVPEDLIAGGLDCLEAMRTDEGYYAYMLRHPGNERQNGDPEGSAGRGPVCELALFLGGRSSEVRLRLTLSHLRRHIGGFSAELGKSLMHAGPAAQGCHYLFFDYLMAARTVEQLPSAQRRKYRALLTDLVLEARLEDGSFQDTPILGRSYGTAAALLALDALRR